eukprot:1105967-Rhodomonas_salina.1
MQDRASVAVVARGAEDALGGAKSGEGKVVCGARACEGALCACADCTFVAVVCLKGAFEWSARGISRAGTLGTAAVPVPLLQVGGC